MNNYIDHHLMWIYMISSMNQVGSVKICITRCGRSHDTQISVQFGRPRVYVCSAGGGRTFMSKTLFILFGIHAHKKVKRALFTVLQHTHTHTHTHTYIDCWFAWAICVLKEGWAFFFRGLIPSCHAWINSSDRHREHFIKQTWRIMIFWYFSISRR